MKLSYAIYTFLGLRYPKWCYILIIRLCDNQLAK